MSDSNLRHNTALSIIREGIGRTISIRTKSGTDYYGECANMKPNSSVVLICPGGSVVVVYVSDIESVTFPFASLTDAEKEIMRDDSF